MNKMGWEDGWMDGDGVDQVKKAQAIHRNSLGKISVHEDAYPRFPTK